MISDSIPSSFRDPSGFVFKKDFEVYRQINKSYAGQYDHLMESGLYQKLINKNLLIPHHETKVVNDNNIYKIIKPSQIEFISYPYEWSFSQLKDAALLTLEIQRTSLEFGMTLKDANAFNIQFHKGKPVLIDTLSFEYYVEGKPWLAYAEFCRYFLAPLALMTYKDVRLNKLLQVFLDGIPLDLTTKLLPLRSFLNSGLLLHIYVHSWSYRTYKDRAIEEFSKKRFNIRSFKGLIHSLKQSIENLKWNSKKKENDWSNYYESSAVNPEYLEHKKSLLLEYVREINPKYIWDLGSNIGSISRLIPEAFIVSIDNDPDCVEKNYRDAKKNQEINILPLIIDINNPSPAIGWKNKERLSFLEREKPEMIFALGILHHLVVSNNLTFAHVASLFKGICNYLIIEFIPKEDNNFQRLIRNKIDILYEYSQENFERTFKTEFEIINFAKIHKSERVLYLMKAIN